MSDDGPQQKRQRGRHPADASLFATDRLPILRTAVSELSWLLERGYSASSALALVGNHHALFKRQRKAVLRCACSDTARAVRGARKLALGDLPGRRVAIDGFNCIITLEAAMSGGVVLIGRDGAHRDLSSVHGSYRRVEATHRAVAALADILAGSGVAAARWLLDRPVSNSGRLKAIIADAAPANMDWQVELVYNPDRQLCDARDWVAASSDAWVLDHCASWVDLQGIVIASMDAHVWTVDLSGEIAAVAAAGASGKCK